MGGRAWTEATAGRLIQPPAHDRSLRPSSRPHYHDFVGQGRDQPSGLACNSCCDLPTTSATVTRVQAIPLRIQRTRPDTFIHNAENEAVRCNDVSARLAPHKSERLSGRTYHPGLGKIVDTLASTVKKNLIDDRLQGESRT